MMTNNEQVILERLSAIAESNSEIKADIKEIRKDVNELKNSTVKLSTDIGWIKVLFTIASSIMVLLLGALITLLFRVTFSRR